MLTDTKLRNLKPRDKLYKVNDREGLYVAVTPAGSISFRYNYSINGRQETITFGRYGVGGITLAEARELLGDAKKMVAAGKSPAKEKARDKARILADHDTMAVVTATKDTASRHADAQGGFRRHRAFVGFATNTVCAEIFAHHKVDYPVVGSPSKGTCLLNREYREISRMCS
ncbi:hypothetical protein SK85_04773 [Escherichia coli]|nr:hypothetical protein BY43_24235 [Escherichia coli O25:NM str. E2539C1]KLX89774.1 hypothetical protein SK85_04773 [Escherichia coli]